MLKDLRVLVAVITLACVISARSQVVSRPDPGYSTSDELEKLFVKTEANKLISSDSLVILGSWLINNGNAIQDDLAVLRGNIIKGRGLLLQNRLDSAAIYLFKVVDGARQGSLELGLANNYLGYVFTRLNNHKRALKEFEEATTIFKSIGNIEYLAVGLTNIGTAYGRQSDYAKALEYFLEAQKLAHLPEVSPNQRSNILGNISISYNMMGKRNESLQYAFAALRNDEQARDGIGICISYNAIGNIYGNNNEFDSAIYYYNQTLKKVDLSVAEYRPIAIRALLNKASVLTSQKKLREAASLLNQIQSTDSSFQSETLFITLAENYLKLGKYDSAAYFARKALQLAKRSNAKISIRNAFANLQQVYYNMHKIDSAYFYQSLNYAYNDSIYHEGNRMKFDNLRVELETLGKEQELNLVKKQAEVDRLSSLLLVLVLLGGFVILFLFLGVTILYYKNRQKRQLMKTRELEVELERKNADLRNQTLKMIYVNNTVQEIESTLRKAKTDSMGAEIQQALSTIHLNKSLEREWDSFNTYFGQIHTGFFDALDREFRSLTISDKRLAGLIRMNLKNKEIAGLLNIEYASVKMSKYRLKRKIGLSDSQDLYEYLTSLTGTPERLDVKTEDVE